LSGNCALYDVMLKIIIHTCAIIAHRRSHLFILNPFKYPVSDSGYLRSSELMTDGRLEGCTQGFGRDN
jgi:hypothetical protein